MATEAFVSILRQRRNVVLARPGIQYLIELVCKRSIEVAHQTTMFMISKTLKLQTRSASADIDMQELERKEKVLSYCQETMDFCLRNEREISEDTLTRILIAVINKLDVEAETLEQESQIPKVSFADLSGRAFNLGSESMLPDRVSNPELMVDAALAALSVITDSSSRLMQLVRGPVRPAV